MSQRLPLLFPIMALCASSVAWLFPSLFMGFKGWIIPLLMLVMLTMGLTLTVDDFKRVLSRKSAVLIGILIQYSIMPLTAFAIAKLMNLPDELLIGMVLVGSASGGTASNVICYLAGANVALSISMTLVSTLLAVIAFPTLSWLYLGQMVPIAVGSMLWSVAKIVLLPLIAGILLNHFAKQHVAKISSLFPIATTLAIVFIIAIIVALNHQNLASMSLMLVLAVALHNLIGLGAGYFGSRLCGHDSITSRTIAIEVGMQNSGLAVALALKYFSAAAALPGALFSVWHNITGSLLAAFWNQQSPQKAKPPENRSTSD